MTAFAEWARKSREEKKISQHFVASALRTAPSTIYRMEAGVTLPNEILVEAWAKVVGVMTDEALRRLSEARAEKALALDATNRRPATYTPPPQLMAEIRKQAELAGKTPAQLLTEIITEALATKKRPPAKEQKRKQA